MMMRGRTRVRALWAFRMKYRSIASVTSKSAMTPSLMGRIATMFPGVRPIIRFASIPTASTFLVPRVSRWTATAEGSEQMIPSPFTYTSVVAVPRSIARSCENSPSSRSKIIPRPPDARSMSTKTYRGILTVPRPSMQSGRNPVDIGPRAALEWHVRQHFHFHRQENLPAMLSILRRNAGSWAIKIILSFIALTFIWWGVGTYSEQGRNVAATVGGEAITTNELAEAVAGLEKSYREVYGPAFTPEMAKALNLKKQAMDSLVQRKILLAEAGKMGLSATDEEVQREIAAVPAFQENGQFREERYRSVLSYNRVGIAEFEASKRVEITLKKVEGLLAAGALVPETEAKELFGVASRKIRLLVVTADPGKAKADAPGDGEILAKYEQAKERFRTPARMKLAVAAFTP